MSENNTPTATGTPQDSAVIQTKKSKWRIIHDFIKKLDVAELVILKALDREPGDDVSLESFDTLTVIAVNSCLNQSVDTANIEDVADMLTHRINNAFALSQKLAKIVSGKQHLRLQQMLMSAAKSKKQAKSALEMLTRK